MDDYALPSWIYMAVLTMIVGGAMKRLLASHLSPAPTVVAWLGATVLVERLWTFCLPVVLVPVLVLVLMGFFRTSRSSRLPAEGRAVFITGCDSGFGKATAKALDSLGFQVFATVLDQSGEGATELRRSCSAHLTLLQVDITQQQQVDQALLEVKAKLGLKGLWALLNNAGACLDLLEAELCSVSSFRSCMDLNFFGTLSVTKSFLPLLRRSRGRILTISSPAGDQPFPCLAAYGASKAALNLLMDSLRHELQPWGIQVSTVLPSSYRTGRSSNHAYWDERHKQLLQELPVSLLEDYGEDYITETKDLFQIYARQADPDVSPVVDTIVEALLAPQMQPRYFAGSGVGLIYFIHQFCPSGLSQHFLQKLFLKKKLLPRALRKSRPEILIHNNNNNNNQEKLQ